MQCNYIALASTFIFCMSYLMSSCNRVQTSIFFSPSQMPLFNVLDCAQAVLEATELQGKVNLAKIDLDSLHGSLAILLAFRSWSSTSKPKEIQ